MRWVSRRAVLLACAVFMALLAAGAVGYARGRARIMTEPIDPVVLSGTDIGFRMVGRQGDRAVGVLVVRVNGRWVDTTSPWATKPVVK